jgi:taurine transport system permease protein
VAVIVMLWFVSTAFGWVNPLFIPAPQKVWVASIDILQNGYKD